MQHLWVPHAVRTQGPSVTSLRQASLALKLGHIHGVSLGSPGREKGMDINWKPHSKLSQVSEQTQGGREPCL